MSFTIDGLTWDIPCSITRVAEMKASDISGMMLNKQYFNDVLGTFMRYTVAIAIPIGYENYYESIYELLTMPVDAHECTFPYNDREINITGRIENVSDVYVRVTKDKQTWRKTQFDVIANHPTKTMSLDQVVGIGMTDLPQNVTADEGDLYEYTSYGWIKQSYDDSDEKDY